MPRAIVEAGEKVAVGRVAFWERDRRHNAEGEVYIVGGDPPCEIYETAAAKDAMAQDRLTRIERVSARGQRQQRQEPEPSSGDDEPDGPEGGGEPTRKLEGVLSSVQRANLEAAGFDTDEKIFEADNAELLEIEGVGDATVNNIRAAQAEE